MPDWLIERGIGETRYALVEGDRIVEARILLDDVVPAGTVLRARLKMAAPRNGLAVVGGQEYLLPGGAPGVSEGAELNIEVTREAQAGIEPWKRPLARASDDKPRSAPMPAGEELTFPAPRDRLAEAGWDDLIEEARSGQVTFADGELRIFATPAMTLIDVDGQLPADELAVAGARAAAAAIRRHGVGGSIGIDLPLPRHVGKTVRQAAAEAIDASLPTPFERTAVNGFGFVQIVRPRRHASTFELAAYRASFEARALLRRLARLRGSLTIVANPKVHDQLDRRPDWIEQLSRQVGGTVTLRAEASLPISAGHAEPA